ARPVAGGVGDPRRPPGGTRGRRGFDGIDDAAALTRASAPPTLRGWDDRLRRPRRIVLGARRWRRPPANRRLGLLGWHFRVRIRVRALPRGRRRYRGWCGCRGRS